MKGYTDPIKEVRKVSDSRRRDRDHRAVPDPARTRSRRSCMMSKKWCEENKAERPVDRRKGIENTAQLQGQRHRPVPPEGAPAVGPHGARAQLQLLGQGRGQRRRSRLHADRQRRDARRRAAVGRDRRDGAGAAAGRRAHQGRANLNVLQGPELRTIFLGMDQKRDELLFSSVKGKNPFKDKRVRQAFYQAIDIETIKARVMRGAAAPTALMVGAGRARLPGRHEQAPAVRHRGGEEAAGRRRLPERLRGRHELPERPLRQRRARSARRWRPTSRASASRSTCRPRPRSATSRRSCAATPASTCSAGRRARPTRTTRCRDLMATPDRQGPGPVQPRRLQQPEGRRADARRSSRETDQTKRNEMIREAFKIHQDDVGHIPLHQQALAWAHEQERQR